MLRNLPSFENGRTLSNLPQASAESNAISAASCANVSDFSNLRSQLLSHLDEQLEEVFHSLPLDFFEAVPESELLQHLKALTAFVVCDEKQEIMLRQPDSRSVTVISAEDYPGLLSQILRRLPDEHPLVGARVFSATSGKFLIDMFQFQVDDDPQQIAALPAAFLKDVARIAGTPLDQIQSFVSRYHSTNEALQTPEEVALQFHAVEQMEHINDIAVVWHACDNASRTSPRSAHVAVASGCLTARQVLQRAADFFAAYHIDISRAYCENLKPASLGKQAVASFRVSMHASDPATDDIVSTDSFDAHHLRGRLATFMRLDEEVLVSAAANQPSLHQRFGDPRLAELFAAMARVTQYLLDFRGKSYSRARVFSSLLDRQSTIEGILHDLTNRFDHASTETAPESESCDTPSEGLDATADGSNRVIVAAFQEVVHAVERMNWYQRGRRSLTLRLTGDLFSNPKRGECPFAVFYVYGQGFDGFHVRFRDVARGGMRFVRTRNEEHHAFESVRLFDEAYRLAAAQQLKNKDIAEGGAKAVVVLRPGVDTERAGRDFIDGLLDITANAASASPPGKAPQEFEHLYLGPDENVSNGFIDWVVSRAEQRGYPKPNTLMSSKPVDGINHKKHGVTSEGVVVFLYRALLESGIQPTQNSFSVKMTGGPDGDVGGNAIRILIRDYQDCVNFVAIADGTGAASDPNGLAHGELLRLVEQGLGIRHFNPDHLGIGGQVSGLACDKEIARRNTLHFTADADVFLPAGGRPSTINAENCRNYLREDGVPSAPIIVEGANLFLTPEARQELSQHGVAIVKDSSANKCGVVCSSLEILAGMLLTREEFQGIRDQYVREVLELLKELAQLEAVSLFNEHARQSQKTLPEISIVMSRQILRVADILTKSIADWPAEDMALARDLVWSHMPPSLVQAAGERRFSSLPSAYFVQMAAAVLASRLVYREGVGNLESALDVSIDKLVRRQLRYEAKTQKLADSIRESSIEDKQLLLSILEHSGTRSQSELLL